MMTLYISNCLQNEANVSYPRKAAIECADDLRKAVCHDYVCAEYRGGKRSNGNFLSSDCLPFDIDNDHTEDESKWIRPADVERAFPGVEFYVHYSRNDMREKGGRKPRPKFHVFFPIARVDDRDAYARLKNLLRRHYPYVDANALDAARFFYGTEDPRVEHHEGEMTVDEFLSIYALGDMDYRVDENGEVVDGADPATSREVVRFPIGEGERNATMFRLARKFLWRHDDTPLARALFNEQAKFCEPPLPERELESIWKSNVAYLARMKAEGKYLPPAEYFRKNAVMDTLRPEDYTDLGQAEVMARYFRGRVAYTTATDFLVYKDNWWQEDEVLARRCAQVITDKQLEEAERMLQEATGKIEAAGGMEAIALALKTGGASGEVVKAAREYEQAKGYRSYVLKRRNSGKIQSSLSELAPLVQSCVKDLDRDPFLLCTPGKTYDLRKGMDGAKDPDPADMLTRITAVCPSEKGKEVWERFLNEAFDGDGELISYVQMLCGVAAIGKVYLEGIVISYGDGGNGKSTFWNTVARVLGSYYGKISADALTTNCKRNVKPELAELRGKRLIIASESQEGARLNDSEIKELCSTDDIRAEKKFKDPFDFTPTHTLVLYTNHLPKVKGTDDGIWRRIIVIPFNHKFTKGDEDIKNYSDVLFEEAGEYVLAWVIEGARKAYGCRFRIGTPKVVRDAIETYKRENDWFGKFVEERCAADPEGECHSSRLYQEYRDFATAQGERPRATFEFYTELERRGYRRINRRDGTGRRVTLVKGLTIKSIGAIDDFDFLG